MININGKEFRNLVEQVKKNQDDIKKHYEIEQTLADWGIKVIDRLDEWSEPTGSFAFGDAIAVGPEGGPFDFYIWTRRSDLDDQGYWLNYGPISIVGPQGPEGKPGPQGEAGKASRWYVGPNEPTGTVSEGDLWLRLNNDNTTNGFVYQYNLGGWALQTTILGPQGIPGKEGKEGKQGPQGPQGPAGPRGYTTITNIIGELPEGSVISDIYNPSTQPANATILMPVGGVQHAWVIIEGMWTDAGPYSGGSTVYVDGVAVNSFNADTKLNKAGASTGTRVYAAKTNGDTIMYPLNTSRNAGGIPLYNAQGNIQTGWPNTAYECANKNYVDSKISEAHNGGSVKSYIFFGMGGYAAGGQLQIGTIYKSAFQDLSAETNNQVEIPTVALYYQMSSGAPVYFSVPYGSLRFKLVEGTWDSGIYRIEFVDANAGVATLEANCYVQNDILTIQGGNGATGCQYCYAALIVPPTWSAEW